MESIKKNGMYFVDGIKDVVLSVDGKFDDPKERPVVALLQSLDHPEIFWAIPVGNLSHRSDEQIKRIQDYIDSPKQDIRSCFYHIGKTNIKSIFFISDVLPITAKYISKEYNVYNNQHYVIKNQELLSALDMKLKRILAYEQSKIKQNGKFFFRQNIFGIYETIVEKRSDV